MAVTDEKAGKCVMQQGPDLKPYIKASEFHEIVINLAKGGILASHRGRNGGYTLFMRPEEITLVLVMKTMERGAAATNGTAFGIVSRIIERKMQQITVADFMEVESDKEPDMLEELKKEVKRARAESTCPQRTRFSDDLKRRLIKAMEEHGSHIISAEMKINKPQLYRWRTELGGGVVKDEPDRVEQKESAVTQVEEAPAEESMPPPREHQSLVTPQPEIRVYRRGDRPQTQTPVDARVEADITLPSGTFIRIYGA